MNLNTFVLFLLPISFLKIISIEYFQTKKYNEISDNFCAVLSIITPPDQSIII